MESLKEVFDALLPKMNFNFDHKTKKKKTECIATALQIS